MGGNALWKGTAQTMVRCESSLRGSGHGHRSYRELDGAIAAHGHLAASGKLFGAEAVKRMLSQ